jgi:hydroxyethylthiazole kinase-like uncharacterized protein yjeF
MKPPFRLPARAHDSHKGDYGRVLIVAGSKRMPGAATLAALGALRGGAGLVTVATPECALPLIAPACPCALFEPLPAAEDGFLARSALAPLRAAAAKADVVVLGPGLGAQAAVSSLLRAFCVSLPKPLVLDADGLNAFAAEPDAIARRSFPTILTPHPGELARLDGHAPTADARSRRACAQDAAKRFRAVVCLKGAGTVVAGVADGPTSTGPAIRAWRPVAAATCCRACSEHCSPASRIRSKPPHWPYSRTVAPGTSRSVAAAKPH